MTVISDSGAGSGNFRDSAGPKEDLMKPFRMIAASAVLVLPTMLATAASAQQVGIGSTKSSVVAQMTAVISKVVSANSDLKMRPQTMGGTQQYIPVVNAGELEFGISNMYQLAAAYRGVGPSAGHKYDNLRLVMTLMPFRVGLLVANTGPVKKVADLKGKRVPFGFKAAPLFQYYMEGFLANGGLTFDDVQKVPAIGLRPMWELFMQGKVDTVIAASGGGPNKEMNAKIEGGVRYLNFDTTGPNAEKTLQMLHNTYYGDVKPGTPFPAVRSPGHVLGYDFTLWAGKSVSDEVVMKVTKALHEHVKELMESSPVWGRWNPKDMAKNQDPIPYHPAAIAYYKKVGLWKETGH
jgi:TRAP transporter TAXI family solute receptor